MEKSIWTLTVTICIQQVGLLGDEGTYLIFPNIICDATIKLLKKNHHQSNVLAVSRDNEAEEKDRVVESEQRRVADALHWRYHPGAPVSRQGGQGCEPEQDKDQALLQVWTGDKSKAGGHHSSSAQSVQEGAGAQAESKTCENSQWDCCCCCHVQTTQVPDEKYF